MGKFIILLTILITLTSIIVGIVFFRDTRKCLEGHEEKYRTAAYTTFIQVGAVSVPTYHPSRIATRFVCDRYEEE